MLNRGTSVSKISLCIALGVALGIFPVLGATTVLCAIAAVVLRLNLPAIQVVNYLVYPLQLLLLAPFYAAGSWFFRQADGQLPGGNLIDLLRSDFWGSLAGIWDLTLSAIFIWLIVSPILVLVVYNVLNPLIRALPLYRSRRP